MTQTHKPRKILIVDQDSSEREDLSHSLEVRGYDVFQTTSAQDTVLLIKNHHIDVVIIAWEIPGMDGIELCRLIREQEIGNYIYIIMLTAKDEKADRLKGFEAGIDAYIGKPPDLEALEAFIKVGMRIAGYDHVLMEIAKQEAESAEAVEPGTESNKDHDIHTDVQNLKTHSVMGTISRQDQVLAKIAVTNKLITKKQLAEAFSIQQKEKAVGKKLSLDTIFFQKKWISKGVLNDLRVAVKRQLGKRFGILAVNKGYITQEQVNQALKDQAQEYKDTHKCRRLGDILLSRGDVTKAQRDEIWLELKMIALRSSAGKDDSEDRMKSPDRKTEHTAAGDPGEQLARHDGDDIHPDTHAEIERFDIKEKALFFQVSVSDDKLEATIRLKKQMLPDNITVDDIRKILELEGILYGLADDTVIAEYLRHDAAMQKTLVAARGKPFVPGKDPYFKFYFDREYLTAGKINEEGEIDYKERGEIPRVKAGDLIVEKIPMVRGTDGIDVYNNPIFAPGIEDIKLRCEDGTTISEDGLKVYAKIEGQPHATVGGTISVFSSFDVDGDVDYRTGNIEFDGNINVKGTVKDGFSVKGGSLTAEEILGATIHVKGDVIVKGGIMGAKIEAEGQVYAKFIKEANIRAYGSVIAEKEILDSKIRTSGEFIAERGKVISSLVAAKKGVTVKDIGTDVSEPCTIKVGADEHIRKIVQGFDRSRDKVKTTLEKAQAEHDALADKLDKVQEETMDLVQEQDNTAKTQRALQEKLELLEKEGKQDDISRHQAVLNNIIRKIESLETDINEKFSLQEELEQQIEDAKEKVEKIINGIEDLSDQKQAVVKWSKKDKANPRINVRGSIYGGTNVSGIHASYVVQETVKNVVIEEVKLSDVEDVYEMKIGKPK